MVSDRSFNRCSIDRNFHDPLAFKVKRIMAAVVPSS